MQMAAHSSAAGEARAALFCFVCLEPERNRGRTVRRFTRHAAHELPELQEASLKIFGFSLAQAAKDGVRAVSPLAEQLGY